jgi:hypothetical protein
MVRSSIVWSSPAANAIGPYEWAAEWASPAASATTMVDAEVGEEEEDLLDEWAAPDQEEEAEQLFDAESAEDDLEQDEDHGEQLFDAEGAVIDLEQDEDLGDTAGFEDEALDPEELCAAEELFVDAEDTASSQPEEALDPEEFCGICAMEEEVARVQPSAPAPGWPVGASSVSLAASGSAESAQAIILKFLVFID